MILSPLKILPLFFLSLVIEKIYYSKNYNCQRLYYYSLLSYINVFFFTFALNIYINIRTREMNRINHRIGSISILSMLILIVIDIILNLLGFFWLISSYTEDRICINGMDMFLAVIFQMKVVFIIFVALIVILFMIMFKECFLYRNKKKGTRTEERYKCILESIYKQDKHISKRYIDKFLNKQDFIAFLDKCDFIEEELVYLDKFYRETHKGMKKDIVNENEFECSICIQDVKVGETIYYLDCGHPFHSTCAKEWFENKFTCPFCKDSIRLKIIPRQFVLALRPGLYAF